jgi:hypothetical protein
LKKLILLIAIVMLIASTGAFAETSGYYVRTIPIIKIYDHTLGYRVVYMKSDSDLHVIYLPKEWFNVAAQTGEEPKAELVAGRDPSYPYFSVFWEEGEFSHIRLYLYKDLTHLSWGDIDPAWDLTDKFKVETLNLEL